MMTNAGSEKDNMGFIMDKYKVIYLHAAKSHQIFSAYRGAGQSVFPRGLRTVIVHGLV